MENEYLEWSDIKKDLIQCLCECDGDFLADLWNRYNVQKIEYLGDSLWKYK